MKSDFLKDVLNEGDTSTFRDQLRNEFRRKVANRRHRRRMLFAMAASIALFAVILFNPRSRSLKKSVQAPATEKSTPILETSPLKTDEIVRTSFAGVATIETRPGELMTISTTKNQIEIVDDAELFALFPNHPVGLISATEGRRLVFIDPADRFRFMSSN